MKGDLFKWSVEYSLIYVLLGFVQIYLRSIEEQVIHTHINYFRPLISYEHTSKSLFLTMFDRREKPSYLNVCWALSKKSSADLVLFQNVFVKARSRIEPRPPAFAMVTNHLRAPYGVYFPKSVRFYGALPAPGRRLHTSDGHLTIFV